MGLFFSNDDHLYYMYTTVQSMHAYLWVNTALKLSDFLRDVCVAIKDQNSIFVHFKKFFWNFSP